MAVPSKPSYSTQPPSIVATDQTVYLAVWCSGADTLLVQVNSAADQEIMWSGEFNPISSSSGGSLFSVPVPLASANLESGAQYEFVVFGKNSSGTGQGNVAYFTAYDRPIVTITPADGSTITGLPLIVAWDVTDSTGVSDQAVVVYDRNGFIPIYTNYGIDTSVRFCQITASDLEQPFEDGGNYQIDVFVVNGVGLQVNAHSDFNISWQPPVTPTATVTTDPDTLAASVTVTGDRSYTFTDVESFTAPESGVITSLAIDGKSVQDGTPTPSAPVAIECAGPYNLLSMSDRKGATMLGTKGIDIVWNSDGWIDVSGTVTGTSSGIIVLWGSTNTSVQIFDAGTYTLSVEAEGIEFSSHTSIQIYGDTSAYIQTASNRHTITTSVGISRIGLFLKSDATGMQLSGRFRVTLVSGSSMRAFQPYGCITARTSNRNLVDQYLTYINFNSGRGISYSRTGDGSITATGTATGFAFCALASPANNVLNLKRGGTYSVEVFGTTSGLCLLTLNGGSTNVTQATYTIPDDGDWLLGFGIKQGNTASGDIIKFQVTEGAEFPAYLAPSQASTAIDLQGHALRSLPDGTHDELTVDSAGVCEIDKNVGMYDSTGVTFESTDISTFTTLTGAVRWYVTKLTDPCVSAITTDNNGYCTLGPYKASPNSDQGVPHFYCYASRVYCLISTDEGVTDAAGAAAWMNAHPLQITYKLATPQTISLGTITPPFVADGATVAIDAAATPTFDATMRAAESAGTPLTDTLMVVRVNPDGTRHVLADDLESGDTVTDPLPPLGVEYEYEVTGIAASGVPSTAAIVPVTIKTGAWALNFGEHAEECVLFRYNPSASYSIEHGGELYHFADGGANGGLPRWYSTTDRDESGSISWDTVDRARAMKLHDLSLAHPVGWIRDPYGRSWRARIVPSMSHERTRALKVSISWDKVVWEEP